MEFAQLLKLWHGGIENGAQTAFSKKLGINQSTVARWAAGKASPDERMIPKVARELGITEDELMASMGAGKNIVKEPPGAYSPDQSFASIVLGRFDQLTKQVADLQERCGVLDYQLKQLQAEVRSTREPKANKTPHEGGGTRKKNGPS